MIRICLMCLRLCPQIHLPNKLRMIRYCPALYIPGRNTRATDMPSHVQPLTAHRNRRGHPAAETRPDKKRALLRLSSILFRFRSVCRTSVVDDLVDDLLKVGSALFEVERLFVARLLHHVCEMNRILARLGIEFPHLLLQ